jgi:hypothetical protein
MRGAALALAGMLLACAGCQRPAEPETWLPRVAGALWVYERRTPDGHSELRVDALGERQIPRLDRVVFLMRETHSAAEGFDAANPVGYVEQDGYLARLEGLVYDRDGRLRMLGDGQATRVLPLAPRPGAHWVQETRVLAAGGGGSRQRWTASVRTHEPVEVPAGPFGDVIEVRTTLRDARGAVRARYRDVFAREVGLIYGVAFGPQDPAPVEELRLLRYRIDAERSGGVVVPEPSLR